MTATDTTLTAVAAHLPDTWEQVDADDDAATRLYWASDLNIHVGLARTGEHVVAVWSDAAGAPRIGDEERLFVRASADAAAVAQAIREWARDRDQAPITATALAAELDVTEDSVLAIVDQLVDIDGDDRVLVGDDALTRDAADTIRQQIADARRSRDTRERLALVRTATTRVRDAEDTVEREREQRDEAVRDAHRAGASVADIARASDLSRQRVQQIITR